MLQITEYKGFTLMAQAFKMAQGYAPRITLTKDTGAETVEQYFDLPITGQGFPCEAEALRAAFDYGKAAIDGKISGIDVSKLR